MKFFLLIAAALSMTGPVSATNTNRATIYLSPRTDGLPGHGTATDPYNGSTAARFDALMKAIPPNTTIRLSAGTFSTNGGDGFQVKSGWNIRGAGMGTTIVKLAGHATIPARRFSNFFGLAVTNVQIGNLTCDGNHAGWNWPAHQSEGGIFINDSSYVLVDHVEVIHCYGDNVNHSEQFSILLSGKPHHQGSHCTVQNCLTHDYAPGANYTNGPMIAYCDNARIVDCIDDGSHHGFGFAGDVGATITGCGTSSKTNTAFYTDSGPNSDLTIERNVLIAAQIPIQFNSPLPEENVKILHNTLKSFNSAGPGEAAIVLSGGAGHHVEIIGNVYRYVGTRHGGLILNNGEHFTDLDIEDNSTNVGLFGGGGTEKSVRDVATSLSGNKFNVPLADLAGKDSAQATAAKP